LKKVDEKNRYFIQLYHHVASAINLEGLELLEVGCGRGGGAAYVKRYLKPRSLTGVDLTSGAINFCRRYYALPGLSFVQGEAGNLKFDDASFDAIINVESSHCYPSMPKFLSEVYRLLRPGGYFLFADFREPEALETLRRQLCQSGLVLCRETDISLNVFRALELDNDRKLGIIQNKVPRLVHAPFFEFAGMKGTDMFYGAMENGAKSYWSFVLQKPV
jgi:ubiquinone/menaquinone biosynthesis C-methylase UbiE